MNTLQNELHLEGIYFPAGLEGLPEWQNFKLEQNQEMAPAALLHCLDIAGLSYIVADPRNWFPSYQIQLTPEDTKDLKVNGQDSLLILSIINVESEPFSVTANLLAPLVINPFEKVGKQIVLQNSPYQARQPISLQTLSVFLPEGLIGLPEWKHFTLQINEESRPVKLLVCKDQPLLSFPVADPWLIYPEFDPKLVEDDRDALNDSLSDLEWLTILTVHDDPFEITANLLSPIVYNRKTGEGRQVVLAPNQYSAKHVIKLVPVSLQIGE